MNKELIEKMYKAIMATEDCTENELAIVCAQVAEAHFNNQWIKVTTQLNRIRGMQVWINDDEMSKLFTDVVNSILEPPTPPQE